MRLPAIVLLFVLLTFDVVLSLKCAPDYCNLVDCAPVKCNPDGEVKEKGGHCLCCDVCKKVVGEGVDCGADTPIAGPLSDKVTCGPGLICRERVCRKIEE